MSGSEYPLAGIDQTLFKFLGGRNELHLMDHLWCHRWMDCKYHHGTQCTNGRSREYRCWYCGCLIGGFIMNAFGAQGVSGFNLTSLIVAILGAIVLLFLVGLVRRT